MTYIAQNDNEYWEERELMNVLEYKEWRNFEKIISKAMIACNISKNKTSDHFVDINKMVDIGSGADILDNLGSEELGANIFRITQTEALLAKQKEKD